MRLNLVLALRLRTTSQLSQQHSSNPTISAPPTTDPTPTPPIARHHGPPFRNTDTAQIPPQEEETHALRLVRPPSTPFSTRFIPASAAVVVVAMARVAGAFDGGVAVSVGSWTGTLFRYGS